MDSVRQSIATAVATFGGINILVNSAGVGRSLHFEELDEKEWHRVLSVNLDGVFHTTKVAMEHLLKQPVGNIVNVASIAGLRGQAYNSHYCASKAGMINFTRAIALEFVSRGLRANCVCPGGVITPFLQHFVPPENFEPSVMAYYMPPVPGLMGEPEDIARTITFLASDDARMVNGAVLGGRLRYGCLTGSARLQLTRHRLRRLELRHNQRGSAGSARLHSASGSGVAATAHPELDDFAGRGVAVGRDEVRRAVGGGGVGVCGPTVSVAGGGGSGVGVPGPTVLVGRGVRSWVMFLKTVRFCAAPFTTRTSGKRSAFRSAVRSASGP